MRVRVVNEDGINWNTKVFHDGTGEPLDNILAIEIARLEPTTDTIRVILEVEPSQLHLVGEAEFYTRCPHCGERIQGVAKE